MKYKACYFIFGCKNVAYFRSLFQYIDWRDVLEENFKDEFTLEAILDLEHEARMGRLTEEDKERMGI